MSHEKQGETPEHKFLFWACFIALIATAFGFVVRSMSIDTWAAEFALSATQKGEIIGAGLWPFAISIVLFSLVLDRIGYRVAMYFAFVCHVASALITIFGPGMMSPYWALYFGAFIGALGNGTIEAVINPVVATVFNRNKTQWLNRLHAGWPGGMLIAGLLAIAAAKLNLNWQVQVGLILLPTIAYGLMMLKAQFPVSERVSAGVSYIDMLREVGALGALVAVALITAEIGRVFGLPFAVKIGMVVVLVGGYGAYTKSIGQPLFVFLLLVMMPLATTELGTDSWITPLMEGSMKQLGLPAVSVLLWTSFIMMCLRFMAGPIVHALSPIGLLMASAAIAAVGLYSLSLASGIAILAAATFYAFGKTFFWPTMLGIVSERFPKGGAMTLNTIAGVGMLSVGIVGAPFLGFVQDNAIDKNLAAYDAAHKSALHSTYVTEAKESVFGNYTALDSKKVEAAPEADKTEIKGVTEEATKGALRTVAILPCVMLVCYILLFLYFKSQGGYQQVHLETSAPSEY